MCGGDGVGGGWERGVEGGFEEGQFEQKEEERDGRRGGGGGGLDTLRVLVMGREGEDTTMRLVGLVLLQLGAYE